MSALDKSDLEILKGFFPASEHEFDYGKNAYIKEQSICNRIEEVDPAWSLSEPKIHWRDGIGGTAICEVTVVITIKGVARGGLGQKEIVKTKNGDAEANQAAKSAATDALKRAARLFGIGRYLLDLPNSVKDERSLDAWLRQQGKAPQANKEPINMREWNETTMTAFWNEWHRTKGIDKDFILASLGVSALGEWTSDYATANKRMNNVVNRASGE